MMAARGHYYNFLWGWFGRQWWWLVGVVRRPWERDDAAVPPKKKKQRPPLLLLLLGGGERNETNVSPVATHPPKSSWAGDSRQARAARWRALVKREHGSTTVALGSWSILLFFGGSKIYDSFASILDWHSWPIAAKKKKNGRSTVFFHEINIE
jgi:hypothetical protein